jgi:hypothetical protein
MTFDIYIDNYDEQEVENNMNKGKLVRVELSPGRVVKMYEQDAIERGLIPAPKEQKKRGRPKGSKILKPQGNKSLETKELPPTDDFTQIDGVGPATARALQARGIRTFEDLRNAGDLHFVSESIRKSIEKYLDG